MWYWCRKEFFKVLGWEIWVCFSFDLARVNVKSFRFKCCVCLFVFAENNIYKPEIHEAERLTYKREGGKTQEVPTNFLGRGGISRIFVKIPHRNLKFQHVVWDILHSFNIKSHHWSHLTDISTKKSRKMLIKVKVRSVILNDLRLVLLLLTHCLCWIRWNHLLNNVFITDTHWQGDRDWHRAHR